MKISNSHFRDFYLFLIVIIFSAPAIYGFYYIENYAIDVPYWDQWDTVVIWTIKYYEGNFDLGILISEQNDSIPVVSNVILLIASLFTDLNIKFIFYVGYIVYVASIIILIYFIKTDTDFDFITLLLLIPIFYYTFNPYYMIRFIQNIGSVQYPILILTALVTIYLLYLSKNSYFYFLVSIVIGGLCTFSFVAGLSIWFAGLVQLGIQKMNDKMGKIIVWITSAAMIFYIYYIQFRFKTTGPHGTDGYTSFFEALRNYPIHKFLSFMGTLGSEVIHQKEIALYFGLTLSLVIVALLYINRKSLELDRSSKWYGLLVFGILTSLEVALTRSGGGLYFGAPNTIFFIPDVRHSLAVFLPIICIYILSILYIKNSVAEKMDSNSSNNFQIFWEKRKHQNLFLLGIIFTLLSLGIILHVMPGIEVGGSSHNQQIANQYYLHTYKIQPDENLMNLYPLATVVRERAALLDKYNLSIFAKDSLDINKHSRINAETYNHIDTINCKVQTEPIAIDKGKGGAIEITGWAVDKNADGPASAVFITIDDEMNIPSIYGLDRPDVANTYKNKNFRYSGFRASFASSILEYGPHNFTIKIVSKDGDGYYTSHQIVNFACI